MLCFGLWALLGCGDCSVCMLFVYSLGEEVCISKYSGLGLPPKLSAITMLNIYCGSAQDNLR